MKKPSSSESDTGYGKFKNYVLGVLPLLELNVSSVESDGENSVNATAKSTGKVVENTVLVAGRKQKRKVGVKNIKDLSERMDDKNITQGVFISTSGFTEDAIEYAGDNGITLLTPGDVEKLRNPVRHEEEHSIFERVFAGDMTLDDATEYFIDRRGKRLFGLAGTAEKVDAVEGRYTPVGRFRLKKTRGGFEANAEGENSVYANLATCELYYVYTGVAGRGMRLNASNVLRRLLDLPAEAVRILSEIMEREELRLDKMDERTRMYYQGNLQSLVALENLGLIGLRDDARGYLSNLNLPRFNDPRYDLERFLETGESVESEYAVDPVVYRPADVLGLLKNFYAAEGVFEGVVYMRYYRCRYVGEGDRVRLDAVEDIRFKNG